jgi:hypothetical protein
MDIWKECREGIIPEQLNGELIRVVESQEQVATNSLVDNFQEQGLLEHMLEKTKPVLPTGTEKLHYLLATPFRYPPLKTGSRFGTRFEPSLFYGSQSLTTALAETGYYRFLFWFGMSEPPASKKFVTQHTIFGAGYKTHHGLKLQNKPFEKFKKQLTSPDNYSDTQTLGTAMRDNNIEAFEYSSARDSERGINVALLSPIALMATQPSYQQAWLCEINTEQVSFYAPKAGKVYSYPLKIYLVKGKLPQPAV